MEQLAEKDQEEQEQKREHDIGKELVNEGTNIMVAAVELKNMQSVKVARLHDHDKKDLPLAKKMKT